jgi:hypothetical protein
MVSNRAVGYCMNVGGENACDDWGRGTFLLNHGNKFICRHCQEEGMLVPERGLQARREGEPFKEVRVEYNYDPVGTRYQEVAIVRDDAITCTGSRYTLFSPLVKTEIRALKVADSILANLHHFAELFDG